MVNYFEYILVLMYLIGFFLSIIAFIANRLNQYPYGDIRITGETGLETIVQLIINTVAWPVSKLMLQKVLKAYRWATQEAEPW